MVEQEFCKQKCECEWFVKLNGNITCVLYETRKNVRSCTRSLPGTLNE